METDFTKCPFFPCRIEQSPDTNKDDLDSAEDTDGGKIDNEEVNF